MSDEIYMILIYMLGVSCGMPIGLMIGQALRR